MRDSGSWRRMPACVMRYQRSRASCCTLCAQHSPDKPLSWGSTCAQTSPRHPLGHHSGLRSGPVPSLRGRARLPHLALLSHDAACCRRARARAGHAAAAAARLRADAGVPECGRCAAGGAQGAALARGGASGRCVRGWGGPRGGVLGACAAGATAPPAARASLARLRARAAALRRPNEHLE
jgi:hypothetical protein